MPDFPLWNGFCLDGANAPISSSGVTVAASGSGANLKGSWTQLIAATTASIDWLVVSGCSAFAATRDLVDIGIGLSSAEQVIIPDLYFAQEGSATQTGTRTYCLPVRIPAGTRIVARSQSTTPSNTFNLGLVGVSAPGLALGRTEACGLVSSGATRGTQVDPGGTINTDGSIVQLMASTSFAYHWVTMACGHSISATAAASHYLVDLLIGASGQEQVLIPDIWFRLDSAMDVINGGVYAFPVNVPVGSRLSVRARCSINTATTRVIDIALWGSG